MTPGRLKQRISCASCCNPTKQWSRRGETLVALLSFISPRGSSLALDVMSGRIFRFRSAKFPIDPKEDEETNPFCYGRSVAEWVRAKLASTGHKPEDVLP